MPGSNLKSLIGKLNNTCRNALESAAGLCLSQTHYEVDIEHFLIKLLDKPNTDFQMLLRHFEINEGRLASDRFPESRGYPQRWRHIVDPGPRRESDLLPISR